MKSVRRLVKQTPCIIEMKNVWSQLYTIIYLVIKDLNPLKMAHIGAWIGLKAFVSLWVCGSIGCTDGECNIGSVEQIMLNKLWCYINSFQHIFRFKCQVYVTEVKVAQILSIIWWILWVMSCCVMYCNAWVNCLSSSFSL